MSLQLMKLALSAETTIDMFSNNTKLFYVTNTQLDAGTITIPITQFFQSDGNSATEFPNFSYLPNLYINGVLQMTSIFSLDIEFNPDPNYFVNIILPAGSAPILNGTPIILEFVKFTPSSTTTVTS
ncbi:DUF4183 domain-containing protein [Bacillus cereus]|uniref:DUF4183 domain-containing protein n=1 Tax=Bacillus cereus TaxID=1396 RepID=UPI0018CF1012|nr:DUF4183 domain-containing protein [Bacillus cereus]MBG9616700.1 hypothetical protein [Bacillus cereus]